MNSILRGFTFACLLGALRALGLLGVFIWNIPKKPLLELARIALPLQFLVFLRLFKPHRLQCRLLSIAIDTEPAQ